MTLGTKGRISKVRPGFRNGKWKVLATREIRRNKKKPLFLAKVECDCGTVTEIDGSALVRETKPSSMCQGCARVHCRAEGKGLQGKARKVLRRKGEKDK